MKRCKKIVNGKVSSQCGEEGYQRRIMKLSKEIEKLLDEKKRRNAYVKQLEEEIKELKGK